VLDLSLSEENPRTVFTACRAHGNFVGWNLFWARNIYITVVSHLMLVERGKPWFDSVFGLSVLLVMPVISYKTDVTNYSVIFRCVPLPRTLRKFPPNQRAPFGRLVFPLADLWSPRNLSPPERTGLDKFTSQPWTMVWRNLPPYHRFLYFVLSFLTKRLWQSVSKHWQRWYRGRLPQNMVDFWLILLSRSGRCGGDESGFEAIGGREP